MAYIKGTSSADTLYGGSDADLIYGYDGNDNIHGGASGDYINGGRGNDALYGEGGDDVFEFGGSGSSPGTTTAGGLTNGYDYIDGGDGYDTIQILPTAGWEWTAIMVSGVNSIEALNNTSSGPGYVYFQGNVNFSSVQSMNGINGFNGSDYNDTFTGSDLAETVGGGAGADTLNGRGGNDVLDGGADNDVIWGGNGDDTVFGGAGNDILGGQAGNDYLKGETGADYFWFEANQGTDIVADYTDGTDRIVVGQSISNVNVLNYQNQALLQFTGSAGTTYALLKGVAPSAIDASDLIFA